MGLDRSQDRDALIGIMWVIAVTDPPLAVSARRHGPHESHESRRAANVIGLPDASRLAAEPGHGASVLHPDEHLQRGVRRRLESGIREVGAARAVVGVVHRPWSCAGDPLGLVVLGSNIGADQVIPDGRRHEHVAQGGTHSGAAELDWGAGGEALVGAVVIVGSGEALIGAGASVV